MGSTVGFERLRTEDVGENLSLTGSEEPNVGSIDKLLGPNVGIICVLGSLGIRVLGHSFEQPHFVERHRLHMSYNLNS